MGENDLPSSTAVEMESAKVEMLTGDFHIDGILVADREVVGAWTYQYAASSMCMSYSQHDRPVDYLAASVRRPPQISTLKKDRQRVLRSRLWPQLCAAGG